MPPIIVKRLRLNKKKREFLFNFFKFPPELFLEECFNSEQCALLIVSCKFTFIDLLFN